MALALREDDSSIQRRGSHLDKRGFVSLRGSSTQVLLRRDGGRETVKEFLFENYEAEGTGPESVQAFLGACRGLPPGPPGVDAAVGLDVVRCISGMYDSAVDHGGAQIPLA